MLNIVKTSPYFDQKPGTSGLRKKVKIFLQENYLENYIQSIFNAIGSLENATLILGGDGRYFNAKALQIILKMAAANECARVIVGQNGYLSTPALSHLIRINGAKGGIMLSASHNCGGLAGDFGIKYNIETGSAAPQNFNDRIILFSENIKEYKISTHDDVDLQKIGNKKLANMLIEIINPVTDYADLMEEIFDFNLIKTHLKEGCDFKFDAMHAVTSPYAMEIFHKRLGVPRENIKNTEMLPDFGGIAPDPLPQNMREEFISSDIAIASDGDGDRNLVMSKGSFISPCDSLALFLAKSNILPYYRDKLYGVARSMPTSRAVDVVAKKMRLDLYETPTGWKFFGNLLDHKKISFCGEESFGQGSLHVREKDGIWAALFWLNILAHEKKPLLDILQEHWREYGRHYYARYDYENLQFEQGQQIFDYLSEHLAEFAKKDDVIKAEEFSYYDAIDQSYAVKQGIYILLQDGRIIYRLSGTGTRGAILRIYIEKYQEDITAQNLPIVEVLAPYFEQAIKFCALENYVTDIKPSNIIG